MNDKAISPLRQRMIEDMTARHFAEKLLQGAAVLALEAHVMDELFEARHVFRLLGDVMEDLLFGQHLNDYVQGSVKAWHYQFG